MFKSLLHSLGLVFAGALLSCSHSDSKNSGQQTPSNAKPNIVFIMADDLGYGDLSCYGQKRFSTPNIDRLAQQGMRFTSFYAGSTVCAPSRSTLLTGLHTGHTPIRGNKEVQPEGQWPLPDSSFTLAEYLKTLGYTTGAFGKWGLGAPGSAGDPIRQGFDVFYGYNCQRLAHNYYPDHLWSNNQKVLLSGNADGLNGQYAPDLIHEQAIEFIRDNQSGPFFLYYPTTIPHAELLIPDSLLIRYRDQFLPEKSYQGVDSGDHFREGAYGSQTECHAAFAAMVTHLDNQVGDIVRIIDELGLGSNTIIFFTSDNGPHLEGGADPDYFDSNGPYRGYKRDLTEGGIRVPMIVRWTGRIKPGTESDLPLAFWDILPTVAALNQSSFGGDGISFVPALTGQGEQSVHTNLYWEFHEMKGRVAIRQGNWKLIRNDLTADTPGSWELYDLSTDPGETQNVADGHPDVVRDLEAQIAAAHQDSEIFPLSGSQILGR